MKVNGIISEYNPFHNGHLHHINASKEVTGADYTVVVMSGNFTQRGEPALIDKFVRARMALENGADLVLELPLSHAASSAEYFARGGVSILNQLHVVNNLCFGSECGDLSLLRRIADILCEEPDAFSANLKSGQQAGLSYPSARNRAILAACPELSRYGGALSSPNNVLGVEYLKALTHFGSQMNPVTVRRLGSDYHDRRFGESFCSALAIRQAVFSGSDQNQLSLQMPKSAYELLTRELSQTPAMELEDFSDMLLYKLVMEQDAGYQQYLDVSPDLSDRIHSRLKEYRSYGAFCSLIKTKNITYTRVSRCLLHILLDMKKEDSTCPCRDQVPYARVLGFRKDAQPLLTTIKKESSIPLITKLADAKETLSPPAYECLSADLRRGAVYESVASRKAGRPARDERSIPIVIV